MLKLLTLLIFIAGVIFVPFALVYVLVTLSDVALNAYRRCIHPRELAYETVEHFKEVRMWTVLPIWIAAIAFMIYVLPKGPARTLAFLSPVIGFQSTQITLTTRSMNTAEQQRFWQLLLPWIEDGDNEIKRRASYSSGSRYGAGRVRFYTDTAHVFSRYRQQDEKIDIAMAKIMPADWLWMYSKGGQLLNKLPKQLKAEFELGQTKMPIQVLPHSASYKQDSYGYCQLTVSVKILSPQAHMWLLDNLVIQKNKNITLAMDKQWPGTYQRFQVVSMVSKHRGLLAASFNAQEQVNLQVVDENGYGLTCAELADNESDLMAAISLQNRFPNWARMQPYIEDVQIKNSRFIPWLAGRGWRLSYQSPN